jgi:hypothetical protein
MNRFPGVSPGRARPCTCPPRSELVESSAASTVGPSADRTQPGGDLLAVVDGHEPLRPGPVVVMDATTTEVAGRTPARRRSRPPEGSCWPFQLRFSASIALIRAASEVVVTANSPAIDAGLLRLVAQLVRRHRRGARSDAPRLLTDHRIDGLAAGRKCIDKALAKKAPRMHATLADKIWTALGEQTVVVAGTSAVEAILPRQAAALAGLLDQRTAIAAQVEKVLDDHPLAQVLTSMPGVGVRTAARILVEIGDASSFPTAGHLAAYAGLAPVTRRSGSSIKGEHPARGGNKRLKNALFLSAFAALHDPESRAYYDRKRAQGKKHNAALICLARRRTYYQAKNPAAA